MENHASMQYRKDIDGLRTIAVLLVTVFHFELVPLGKGGFLGVDIFFVISGYLISAITFPQLEAGEFHLRNFYFRRIKRLAPALFSVLLFVMVYTSITYYPHQFIEIAHQIAATQFYVSNIYFWQNINYFGLATDNVPLLHTWSLAVEEQFYLVYPVALIFIFRFAKHALFLCIVLATLASFLLNIYFVSSKPELTFYLMPTRAWELLAGALAFFAIRHVHVPFSWVWDSASAMGFLLIAGAVVFYTPEVNFPGYYALIPVLGTVLLIVSGAKKVTFGGKILSHPAMVYVGKLSYAIYLVHWPVHVFATDYFGDEYTLLWRGAMLGITLLLAAVIYHVIEQPIRKGKSIGHMKKCLVFYTGGLIITGTFFVVITQSHGLPARFTENELYLASFANDKPEPLTNCAYHAGEPIIAHRLCRIGDTQASPRWLIYGDSHAWAIHEAFAMWLKRRGESAYFIYRHTCVPLHATDIFRSKGECLRFNDNIQAFITAQSAVENIVLVSVWAQVHEALITPDQNQKLDNETALDFFNQQFTATLSALQSLNKTIYLWEPLPGAKADVPNTLAHRGMASGRASIEYTSREYYATNAFFFKALSENRDKIRTSFSPAAALCETGHCRVVIDGKPLYYDSSHLAFSSMPYWSGILEHQFHLHN